MRKYLLLFLMCLLCVACKQNKEEEPKTVDVTAVLLGSDYAEIKILYADTDLPVHRYTLTGYDHIDVYDTRSFTIKIRNKDYGDYSSIYVDDFISDESLWCISYYYGKYSFNKS